MELQHFSHQHSLVFVQEQSIASTEEKEEAFCFGCGKVVDGPSYCCNECKFYLHKNCAELELAPEIDHLFHPQHPLTLLPKSPYSGKYGCDFCDRSFLGFVYHCAPCEFDLDINCALLQSSIAENFPNSLHEHPLIFVQNHVDEVIGSDCAGCEKALSGPIYHCLDCDHFYLHKKCSELPLEINHLFHPQHLLTLLPKSPHRDKNQCDFCGKSCFGFVYHCAPCKFQVDIKCALLQSSIAKNFPSSLHEHPMFFIQDYKDEFKSYSCAGCEKPLSDPIYGCLGCHHFYLHKECAELPLEINHPYDRMHPLTLLPNPPIHPENCCCYLCKIKWKGFVYGCSLCKFELTAEDVSAPQTITATSHENPWTLLSSQISFICDFCGITGDRTPYFCTTCNFLVHKNCISMPHKIMITRHHHVISHSYSLQQNQLENWECRICYDQVNGRYGSYSCFASNCNYIVHVNCATDKEIWDETVILKDKDKEDERSKEALEESMNLITKVIEEDLAAIEIKYAYHDHNLMLSFSGDIKDDEYCDGCIWPLSTPFYSCEQCKFFLHKNCAELLSKKRHPFHKHLLTLTKGRDYEYRVSFCTCCNRHHHGFSYKCLEEGCYFEIDIQCSLLSDTLKHPSHGHPLYIVHNYSGKCSGCLKKIGSLAYRCTKRCDFTIDLKCATLPLTAWYKYDRHPLALTYFDDSDPCQHYCDLCENERDPNHWFYYCADCDNSLHSNCALGELPLIKIGRKVDGWIHLHPHPHPLTFVKNIWNCPPCTECGELCNGQTLECKESECNYSIHWSCPKNAFDH